MKANNNKKRAWITKLILKVMKESSRVLMYLISEKIFYGNTKTLNIIK